jgi:hypothetical protein
MLVAGRGLGGGNMGVTRSCISLVIVSRSLIPKSKIRGAAAIEPMMIAAKAAKTTQIFVMTARCPSLTPR